MNQIHKCISTSSWLSTSREDVAHYRSRTTTSTALSQLQPAISKLILQTALRRHCHHLPATTTEGTRVTATTWKQEQLQSNLSSSDWTTTSPRSIMGKMKVLKVAQMPCHNLGRAGIVAEVVRSAPRREGAPGITHQEVPNQLRRDAHRLCCTFFFFSSKKIAGTQYQWTRISFPELYVGDYIGEKKIHHRFSVNSYHWIKPILWFLFINDSKIIRSE